MRTRFWFLGLAILAICTLLVLFLLRNDKTEPQTSAADQPFHAKRAESTNGQRNQSTTGGGAAAPSATTAPVEVPYNPNVVGPNLLTNWRAPIEFYGKVVDQNGIPVPKAKVELTWMDSPAEDGSRYTNTESSPDGLFSFRGARGPTLQVFVSKEGYYSRRGGAQYGPLAATSFSPDEQSPVIFLLRKKNTPESLIHVGGTGLRSMRDFLLSPDGKPTNVSLRDGKLAMSNQGDLSIEFLAGEPLGPAKISWQCRISVPGGGLLQTDEEFPFLAPEDGYQPSDQWSVGATNWTERIDKQYYLKLRDGNFGRVRLRVIGVSDRAYFRMESFLNPSGSRNLEPAN